jgi:uncharacterized membrane protein
MLRLAFIVSVVAAILLLVLSVQGIGHQEGARERVLRGLERTRVPGVLSALFISALPIFELRGGIPVAVSYLKIDWRVAYVVCVVGNMLPVVPVLLFLGAVSRGLSRFALWKRFFDWLFERTRRRGGIVERYRCLGLMFFVAIPLPITGAWTGSVAAFLFGMRLAPSVLFIFLGVLIAGGIVTVLSLLGVLGGVIAGVALFGLAGWTFLYARNRRPS